MKTILNNSTLTIGHEIHGLDLIEGAPSNQNHGGDDMLETGMEILAWLKGDGGMALLAVLFPLSEFLGGFDKIKQNSVYQVVVDGLATVAGWLGYSK